MKTLQIIHAKLGQARAYMAKTLLGAAAQKATLDSKDKPKTAELSNELGESLPNDTALNGT
ncbi:PTS fructose transporter subunit EIIBC, partial [Salmonella enterica subsp. enterica serovar Weltevreden]|nr:PTS fructose transporter subunit EIIBC [Salmonella enterica subsp. enterica serovar Weltevreden]